MRHLLSGIPGGKEKQPLYYLLGNSDTSSNPTCTFTNVQLEESVYDITANTVGARSSAQRSVRFPHQKGVRPGQPFG